MALHDYECKSGHVTEHYTHHSALVKHIKCPECGARAHKTLAYAGKTLPHNWAMSSAGYQKGVVDAQTGVDYANYTHKKQVLREQGQEEVSGPMSTDEIIEAEYNEAQREQAARNSFDPQPLLSAESVEELEREITKDMRKRQVLNPEHGLRKDGPAGLSEDGWVYF